MGILLSGPSRHVTLSRHACITKGWSITVPLALESHLEHVHEINKKNGSWRKLAGQQPQAHLFSHALESEQCTPTPNGPGASVQAGGLRAAFPVLCAFAALPRAGIWAGAYAPAPALGDFCPALVGVFKHQRQCVLCSKSSPLTHSVMVLHIVPNELGQRDFETYVR